MRRRGNNEGSIYQTTDGRWRAAVVLADGRRKYVSAKTREGVVRRLRLVQRRNEDGLPISTDGRPPTVEAWLNHWLDHIASAKVRPSTLEGYRSKVRTRIVPTLGRYRLDRLQPEQVEAWRDDLLAEGLAPSTVVQCQRVLSRALKVAMQRGRVARNVCALVDTPSIQRDEVQPLTADEARRVLVAASRQRNSPRWSVALALGLRQGEALGLPWNAIDLDAGTLAVRQALQRQTGKGLVIVRPKSRAGRRVISLPGPLVDALRAHRAAQAEERLAAGSLWRNEHGLVFTQPTGRPVDPSRDYQDWQQLLVSAGVRKARLHDARHTAASLLLAQGVPARVVMEMLGHSQITLTLGTYSHVAPELQQEAADRMGRVLWRSSGTPS
jgi:integrase